MKRQKITLRTANERDFRRFYGVIPPPFVGITAENEYMILGLGGILQLEDKWWIFLRRAPSVRNPVTLMKAARAVMSLAQDFEEPVYAVCDVQIPGAEKLLRHLGFRPTDDKREGNPIWSL